MGTEKINGNELKINGMFITLFQVKDEDEKSRFFNKTFLLADISINIAFEISFLTLSNVKVNFNNKELR